MTCKKSRFLALLKYRKKRDFLLYSPYQRLNHVFHSSLPPQTGFETMAVLKKAPALAQRYLAEFKGICRCRKSSGCLHSLCKTAFVFCPNDWFRIFGRYQESCGFAVPFGILGNARKSQIGLQAKKKKCKQHQGLSTFKFTLIAIRQPQGKYWQ